ncbi:D-alanyl-D-alanine carboxypeptidase family protein [Amorphus orientalis]|uniref:D-alanyl-D-alanine carboxypeptidase n=1 Tax=Amorphus orientalis TaxID=649198 RepID=A0AAE4ASN3_9HYPH|nr:D-alanyl-D-alanine carboxypeptidase family protein [Amorphus orientalis]MDQ0315297.1 D-alanyl-D-alanine carboxypeptidase [Amorphus orientalis]
MSGSGAVRQLWRSLVLLTAALALAACQSTREPEPAAVAVAPAPVIQSAPISVLLGTAEVRGHSVYVADMITGKALFEENAEALRFPASLTKMMTLFLLFEEVEAGRLALSDELPVSQEAASRPPSKLGLRAGSTIRVTDAAQAMAIKSANDVAVVVAEAISGSEQAFAQKMTARARELGMYRTRFVNASGLPDPMQVSTARDMAILGRALKTRFPRFAPYFRAEEFTYNGRRYEATNDLLGTVRGVDGIKTGYIRASGFHLAVSVRRGGRRLIVVVMGGKTGRERDREVTALIERYM